MRPFFQIFSATTTTTKTEPLVRKTRITGLDYRDMAHGSALHGKKC